MGEREMKPTLLGSWSSPFVQRVKWVLKLKGIQYDYSEQDLFKKSSLLLNSNPVHRKVPVLLLDDGRHPIAESLVIIEFLDDVYKNKPVLPADPYHRAMARFWAKFVEEKFSEVARKVLLVEGEQQERAVKDAKEALKILEGELKGKKFFGGEDIGLVDIALGSVALWLGVIEEVSGVQMLDSLNYPSLAKWKENFLELPEINEGLPSKDDLVPYYHKIRQYGLAMAAGKKIRN
ncbi:glutathione transferase [Sarracenia purpurea var. burkii]